MQEQSIVVVSNRGPYTYVESGADLRPGPAAGGLASALGPVMAEVGATWIAAANGPGDRKAAAGHVDGGPVRLRLLDVEEDLYRRYYDDIANSTLWFVHHGMYDRVSGRPFDADWHRSWRAYRAVNRRFAEAVAEVAPAAAVVLVQDYHLALVGSYLARRRQDLRIVHFSHTPFATPSELEVLPGAVVRELLEAMTAYHACGFHSSRWEEAFRASSESAIGECPRTFVAPLGPDLATLRTRATSSSVESYRKSLVQAVRDRKLIVRVDRLDPAKNLVRGFLAFDELLRDEPRWRNEVVFLALTNPSRESTAEYAAYRRQVEETVTAVNGRWATPGWNPIMLVAGDNIERSMAALRHYDVLLVNPVRDGLNLVAKEGPLVNDVDGAVVLSRESGAWSDLAPGALGVNPFDTLETTTALARALDMSSDERAVRAASTRSAAARHTPDTWLRAQLEVAGVHPRLTVRLGGALGPARHAPASVEAAAVGQ